jgi:hypothetical protein
MPDSTDMLIKTDKGLLKIYREHFKIRAGQEYRPYDLLNGISIISNSSSFGET